METVIEDNTACAIVLNNGDLVEYILKFLEYHEISGVGPVNKTFYETATRLYERWMHQTIRTPCEILEKEMVLIVKRGFDDVQPHHAISAYIYYMRRILNDYWLMFVKDLEFMERMFCFTTVVFGNIPCNLSDTEKEGLNVIRNELLKYFYIEYPDNYDAEMLHLLARYKHGRSVKKFKRSRLIKLLTRPEGQVYHIPDKI